MSSDWAANDYEPTADEIQEFLEGWRGVMAEPGHGSMSILPSMERYIWEVEGVYWGHREILGDGRVSYSWLVPERMPH